VATAYDFHNLSYFEFELLVRDLLQAEWEISIESFATGRDRGIDLRHACTDDGMTIVQCKHWAKSGFQKLLHELQTKELPKIEALSPERYVLATSVRMTPDRKTKLIDALAPFIRGPADVIGFEDLNNLLGKHERIERQHFKLWLASATVLQAIVNSDIYARSREFAETLNERLPLYVQNVSFMRAMDILTEHRVCVIAGIPGIGKTMLGDVLVAAHIAAGYEPILISGDVTEAWKVLNDETKQIFYFDDFLGQTSFREKFEKNGDDRLLRFMAAVARRSSKRFILTTREYILQQATVAYEKLWRVDSEFDKLIIDLADYTRLDRARILYNHLYFSDVATPVIVDALADGRYREIIGHQNYNPRLIEAVTKLSARDGAMDGERFYEFFIRSLDNPAEIWSHAFQNQLSPAAQCLLLLMLSLPSRVALSDLEKAAGPYFEHRLGSTGETYEIVDSLRQLEGNFCTIDAAGLDRIVSFHNPSIRDFLRHFLNSRRDEFIALLESAYFVDQVQLLLEYAAEADDTETSAIKLSTLRDRAIAAHQRTYYAPTCQTYAWFDDGARRLVRAARYPTEERLARMVELGAAGDASSLVFLKSAADELADKWNENRGDKNGTLSLLKALRNVPELRDQRELLEKAAKRWFMFSQSTAEDYEQIIGFVNDVPDVISEEELDALRQEFLEWAPGEAAWIIDEATDSSDLERRVGEISMVAQEFGLHPEDVIDYDEYDNRMQQLDYEPEPDDIPRTRPESPGTAPSESEQIDALFDAISERD
jgi:hypothetical protein